jgi:hypothetical protein
LQNHRSICWSIRIYLYSNCNSLKNLNNHQTWWCRAICELNQNRIRKINWIRFFYLFHDWNRRDQFNWFVNRRATWFRHLREDHKNQMHKYRERIDVLKNLNIFILTSVDRFNLIYLRNQKTIYQKIISFEETSCFDESYSKTRDDSKYKNLQKALKHQ